ncbi:MAG UNVERIFIED_CONTAM: hypothetical protein LVT10_19495 [Anaerolineae bacterium]|jgi:hypothetical protein
MLQPTLDTHNNQSFTWDIISLFIFTMSFTLFAFALAYIKDLETLRNVPNQVWDAICGRPSADSLELPLLISGALTLLVIGGALKMSKRLPFFRR